MADKTSKNFKKSLKAVEKQLSASLAKVSTNRTCIDITLTIEPDNAQKNNREKLRKVPDNIKDGFSWETIAGYQIPCITRLVDGKNLKFVATRMAEYELLKKYLNKIHPHIYTSCTPVIAYVITDSEMKILNYINKTHYGVGKDCQFFAGKDYIVRLEDIHNFYLFIEICYKKLVCNATSGHRDKCGFMCIDSNPNSCIIYYNRDGQKYFPLSYFEGETETLKQRAIKLENWDLAYLKFCFKLRYFNDEFFEKDSCLVVSLNDIKSIYPPETYFHDVWPANLAKLYLLNNQNNIRYNLQGAWFRVLPEVVEPDQNTIPDTSTASVPIIPQSTQVMKNEMQQQQKQQKPQQKITTPQIQAPNNSHVAAYKMKVATLGGKAIPCINAKPCIFSDWMVTLKDLVWMVLPSCTVAKCAHVLHILLKKPLLFGKSEQLAVLRGIGLIQSMNPGDTPMAMVKDVTEVLPQLKTFALMQDEELKRYKPADGPSK